MPFESIAFDQYAAREGLNAGAIVYGMKSMRHMNHAIHEAKPESAAMRWGRLCHMVLLEPNRATTDLAIFDGAKRGKAWEEFKSANETKDVVTEDEALWLSVMATSVHSNPAARQLLVEGRQELSMFWETPEYGKAKGRMDVYSDNAIVDLKMTADLSRFKQTAAKMGYHVKAGWYQRGVEAITEHILPVYILAVEDSPPHDLAIYEYDQEALAVGRDVSLAVAKQYRQCQATGIFPGMYPDIQTLRLPEYLMTGDEPLALKIGGQSICV